MDREFPYATNEWYVSAIDGIVVLNHAFYDKRCEK